VTIVEYLNPFCVHCRRTHERLERVIPAAGVRARRHRVQVWSTATPPLWARACAAAATLGREDALWAELLRAEGESPHAIWAAARRAGLDPYALSAAVSRGDSAARIDAHRQYALSARLTRVPTIDIGRRRLQGEQSEAELRAAIQVAAAGEDPSRRAPSVRGHRTR
jgi:protein-disulfide isomerase